MKEQNKVRAPAGIKYRENIVMEEGGEEGYTDFEKVLLGY